MNFDEGLIEQLINYLALKPWQEVNNFIVPLAQGLNRLKSLQKTSIPPIQVPAAPVAPPVEPPAKPKV